MPCGRSMGAIETSRPGLLLSRSSKADAQLRYATLISNEFSSCTYLLHFEQSTASLNGKALLEQRRRERSAIDLPCKPSENEE